MNQIQNIKRGSGGVGQGDVMLKKKPGIDNGIQRSALNDVSLSLFRDRQILMTGY
jgi:hypothetical protein